MSDISAVSLVPRVLCVATDYSILRRVAVSFKTAASAAIKLSLFNMGITRLGHNPPGFPFLPQALSLEVETWGGSWKKKTNVRIGREEACRPAGWRLSQKVGPVGGEDQLGRMMSFSHFRTTTLNDSHPSIVLFLYSDFLKRFTNNAVLQNLVIVTLHRFGDWSGQRIKSHIRIESSRVMAGRLYEAHLLSAMHSHNYVCVSLSVCAPWALF